MVMRLQVLISIGLNVTLHNLGLFCRTGFAVGVAFVGLTGLHKRHSEELGRVNMPFILSLLLNVFPFAELLQHCHSPRLSFPHCQVLGWHHQFQSSSFLVTHMLLVLVTPSMQVFLSF